MIYVEKQNNIITGRFSADEAPTGDQYEADPNGVSSIGDNRARWDADWNPRPLADLVAEGLETPPWGWKWNGKAFVEMTTTEKIKAKVIVLEPTQILDGDEIRDKTPAELGADHLIDLEVLKSLLVAQVSSLHPVILARGFTLDGAQYSGKDSIQQRATGILTAVVAGIPPSFPMAWPNAQDETVYFQTLAEFKAYAVALMAFVQKTDTDVGQVKTDIRAATDTAVASKIYTDWEASIDPA